jgi:hypothetical protein
MAIAVCPRGRADEVESGKEEGEVEGRELRKLELGSGWRYAEPRTWTAMQTTQMLLRYPHPVPTTTGCSDLIRSSKRPERRIRDAVQPEQEASPPGFIGSHSGWSTKEDSLLQSDANLMINGSLRVGVISAKPKHGRFIPNDTEK